MQIFITNSLFVHHNFFTETIVHHYVGIKTSSKIVYRLKMITIWWFHVRVTEWTIGCNWREIKDMLEMVTSESKQFSGEASCPVLDFPCWIDQLIL